MDSKQDLPRYRVREDGAGGYGVWDRYAATWADTDCGDTGLSEGDAETIAAELNEQNAAIKGAFPYITDDELVDIDRRAKAIDRALEKEAE